MPKVPPYPLEFRQRAVELYRSSGRPLGQIARELGMSETGLRNWVVRVEIDTGQRDGLSSEERRELVELRRDNRRLEMEVEILKRASAYFARENILPK
jgi:transposase